MQKQIATAVLFAGSVALHVQDAHVPLSDATASPVVQRRPFGAENTTTIHIRLVNGKTGQPIANKEVFLERQATRLLSHAEEKDIRTDASGVAEATVSQKADILNPIVVDYKSCTPRTRRDGEHDKSERFPIAQILSTGIVAQNTCGKATQSPTPGELVLYFRTMNVFEKITD